MIRCGVAVMAHRKREAFIPELLDALDRPAEVVWDRCNDRWETGRRSLLAYDPETTHHLVVQDDAVICRDLVAGVEKALVHVPDGSPLCLYVGRLTPFGPHVNALASRAERDGVSWLSMDGLHWGVGIVLPTPLIPELVAWGDRNPNIANYDRRIGRWLDLQQIRTWYPWPSLVDHRDSPSLVPGRGRRGRTAHRFLGRDVSALDVDWSGDAIRIDALRRYPAEHRSSKERKPMSPVPAITVSGDIFVARDNARVTIDGRTVRILRNRTHAHADSWIVAQRPHLWRPLRLDFGPDGKPAESDGSVVVNVTGSVASEKDLVETIRGAMATGGVLPSQAKPAAKDVRAWAKGEDIDVPASGPLPHDIVERYVKAHETED